MGLVHSTLKHLRRKFRQIKHPKEMIWHCVVETQAKMNDPCVLISDISISENQIKQLGSELKVNLGFILLLVGLSSILLTKSYYRKLKVPETDFSILPVRKT